MRSYVKVPTVFQMEATECGAASLAMILAHFNSYIPLEQLRVECGVSRDGVKAASIMRAAKRMGLGCRAFRREPDDLRTLAMPCIIHWNFMHFVVLEGFKGKYAYINDPAYGRRRLTMDELDDAFTGVVLTFEKTEAFRPQKKQSTVPAFIASRLKGYMPVLAKLLFIGLLLFFPGLILPVLSQVFIDDVLLAGYHDWLVKLLVFIGGTLLMQAALSYYRDLLLQKLKSKMTLLGSRRLLTHMMRLPAAFFDQRHAGDLADRLSNNEAMADFLAGDLAEAVLNVLVAAFYLVILFVYSAPLTLIGLCNVAISLTVAFVSNHYLSASSVKLQMTRGRLWGAAAAGVAITDSIKASGVEDAYAQRLMGHYAKNVSEEQRLSRLQQMVSAVPGAAGRIADVLLLVVGGALVISGQLTAGMLVAFNELFDSFCDPIGRLATFVQSMQTFRSNICRVEDVERHPVDPAFDPALPKVSLRRRLNGHVQLDGLTFGYSTHMPPLVQGISLALESGQSVAFVGASGCGKSTVSKMVSGLYQPWQGVIRFDGVPLLNIPQEVLHASVATVSQSITLFSGSVRDNITLWNSAIPQADIEAAARDACIHDFIMQQPGGYDYLLTENAGNLSGGQRQRMEIARALALNPSILIMDEATSALDPLTEKQILDNIKRRGCTCVVVAHRLSAIRDCDRIAVLEGGQITELGTHEELMRLGGSYSRFVSNI